MIDVKVDNCEMIPLGDLQPFQRDLKTLSEENYERLRDSIKNEGFVAPIFVWKNKILDGHQRLRVIEREGWTFPEGIPVVRIKATTEKEAARLLLHIASSYGRVDGQGLFELASHYDLELPDLPTIDLPNFDYESFLLEHYADPIELAEDLDETSEPPNDPITSPGDIWLLGNHRLMCGDAKNADHLDQLISKKNANLFVTDPPYGVSVVPKDGKLGQDRMAKNKEYRPVHGDDELFDPACIFMATDQGVIFGANFFHDKLPLNGQWIVWDKGRPEGIEYGDAELAWTSGSKRGISIYRVTWHGMIREGESGERVHPTQKPVKLISQILEDFSKPKDIVYDPFLGSGTTLIASEKTNRICYGMEIDPGYCDVIIKRWQDATGQIAINCNTDEPFTSKVDG